MSSARAWLAPTSASEHAMTKVFFLFTIDPPLN